MGSMFCRVTGESAMVGVDSMLQSKNKNETRSRFRGCSRDQLTARFRDFSGIALRLRRQAGV
jgi:hypothetical protein